MKYCRLNFVVRVLMVYFEKLLVMLIINGF